jgi:hypothetical protein
MEDFFDDSTWSDIKVDSKVTKKVTMEDDFWEVSGTKKEKKEIKVSKAKEISEEEKKSQEFLNSVNPDDLLPSQGPLKLKEPSLERIPQNLEENEKLKKEIENLKKSLKVFEENEKIYKNEINSLIEKLYVSDRVPIHTTNGGNNLQIVGKNLTNIPIIYQQKLGNVIESIDFSFNQIK